ncbi:DUF4224 domain-containing protein [Polynucleobacter sp. JS-Safj-400b-B2]|uniref:DUF4224 domain-containing protein n=1 Tax=Polynucleobacter sp. JS-Safj-400b-B2 TaxID=2576921 RepID=UPI001C0B1F73|nr:DUF4224 domain-containing protein [Polynucleobacter sp. JS-Safj-400b-B2]MBU3625688.1 DUF4224 domain-containing protein [Polynucleobacter sp. JS-Safj-400b-B2]
MFLSKEELKQFTGYQIVSCQIRALKAFGVPFAIGLHGRPVVLKSEVERLLGSSDENKNREHPKEPDWNALGA